MTKLPIAVFLILFTFSAYAQKTGDDAEAYLNKGFAKHVSVDYYGAIKDYNKAIELKPDFANAYVYRGLAKGDLGDYKGGIQDYNKAIELKPDDAKAYYFRGINKGVLDDKKGACLDLSKAGELGYYEAYEVIKQICK